MQCQFLSWVYLVWNQFSFSEIDCLNKAKEASLPSRWMVIGFIPFWRILVLCLGFELMLQCPFHTTIAITPQVPQRSLNVNFYIFCIIVSLEFFWGTILSNMNNSKTAFWPIDRILTGTTTPGQCKPRSNVDEGILHVLQSTELEFYNHMQFGVLSRTTLFCLTPLLGIQ